jgi:hypothetical protein
MSGIIIGNTKKEFLPKDNATRAEAANIFALLIQM